MANKDMATLIVNLVLKTKKFSEGTDKVKQGVKGMENKLGKFGKTMKTIGKTIATGFIAKKVIKAGVDFEASLAELGSVANVSGKDLKALGDDAQSMATKFGVSSNDVVHGLAEMKRLSFETADSLKEMPKILKFMKTSGSDFNSTIALMESTISDFKLDIKDTGHITDVFTKAMSKGAVKSSDFNEVISKSGSAAKGAGVSIESLAAATQILRNKGISASVAGTSLKGIFASLSTMGPKTQKAFKGIGFSVLDAHNNMKPFPQIIEEIKEKTNGMTDAQKNQFAELAVGKGNFNEFLALLDGAPGSFAGFVGELENSSGATEKAWSVIDKTAKEKLSQMGSGFEVLAQKVGTELSPVIADAADSIKDFIKFLQDPSVTPFVQDIGALAIAVGILMGAVKLWNIVVGVARTLQLLWNAAMLANPIGLIILAIGLIAAALVYAYNRFDWFKEMVDAVGQFIYDVWMGIPGFFVDLWNTISNATEEAWTDIKKSVEDAWNGIKAFFSSIPSFFSALWNKILSAIASFIIKIVLKVAHLWMDIKAKFSEMAKGALKWGKDMFTQFGNGIVAGFKYVKQKVIDAANWVKSKLGFSVPESGPLSKADTWMPDMMKLMTKGIEMGIPKLEMAVGDVAGTIAGAEPTTNNRNLTNNVNVYPRSVNFTAGQLTRELDRLRFLNGGVI